MNSQPGLEARHDQVQRPREHSLGRKAALVFTLAFALAAANIIVANCIFGYSDDAAAMESLLATLVEDELNWRRNVMLVLYGLFVLDILLLLLAYVAFRRHVLAPLVMLADYCRELGRGNYAVRVSYPEHNEIGILTRALNDLAIETHALMEKIETAARQASLVFESTSEAIVVTDAQGGILNTNPAFSVITGYAGDEVVGRNMSMLSSGRQSQDFYRALWRSLRVEGRWSGDLWNRRKNGEEYAEYLTINAVLNDSGAVHCFIGVFSDVTKQKRSEAFIWRQAHYDSLTGLPNRQHFHIRLEEAITRAARHGTAAALMLLDLDFFKGINDTLGHDMGDELLRQVSMRLSGSVREMDTVARLGGDEFTLIIADISDASAVDRIIQNLLRALSAPYTLGEHTAEISASLGVTLCPEDGLDAVELLKNADLAMYAAKEGGRNQYRRFVPSMREAALVHRQMQRDLQIALTEQQFFLLYQPIIRLSDGRITQVEALLHWNHPAQGVLGAQAFMAFAEDAELTREISNWVFREATTQRSVWVRSGVQEVQVSIDFSMAQLLQDGIDLQDWRAHLDELGMPADTLVVEIAENLLMGMGDTARQGLLALRGMGVQVALDHFGTGESSLISLNRIGLDFLKIDASFIANLDQVEGADNLALCQAAIAMAHKLGLKVIADGVATVEQSALLRSAWCDYAQGHFFVEPVPASQLAAVLAARVP